MIESLERYSFIVLFIFIVTFYLILLILSTINYLKEVEMAIEDQIKWDTKYSETPKLLEKREVGVQLKKAIKHSKVGMALDIACGAGKNSIYLAENDFDVESLDISKVALDVLEEYNYKNITTVLTDLDGFSPIENKYDLIVMTNFLDRDMIPRLVNGLTSGGILFIETYMVHISNTKKSSNLNYLLKEGELKTFFDENYKILDYSEFDNEPYELYKMRKQSITIQKSHRV